MNLEQRKQQLLAAKAEIEERLQRTHKHIHQRAEPVSANFHEQVNQTSDDALVLALDQEGRDELVQINHALHRLQSGEYQYCSRCGQLIGEQRLAAIPFTEHCIKCAA